MARYLFRLCAMMLAGLAVWLLYQRPGKEERVRVRVKGLNRRNCGMNKRILW